MERIQVYKGRNPAGEAAYVCSRIEQMIKEEGMRYRDAAVITGDLPSYGRELAHQFDEAGIPYFLDDKKSILENPMVELIRAALEMVKDFSYESVFRYLKTGLVYEKDGKRIESEADGNTAQADDENIFDGSREHVEQMTDRLENYVRALGIRGWKRWDSCWERQYRGGEKLNLKELNQYRMWILEPLRPLREAFKAEGATIASVTAKG